MECFNHRDSGADLGGGCRGCAPPPPPEMTCGFLIQLVFCQTMWFIGVEVEQEKSAPPPKKNPGSAPETGYPYFIRKPKIIAEFYTFIKNQVFPTSL